MLYLIGGILMFVFARGLADFLEFDEDVLWYKKSNPDNTKYVHVGLLLAGFLLIIIGINSVTQISAFSTSIFGLGVLVIRFFRQTGSWVAGVIAQKWHTQLPLWSVKLLVFACGVTIMVVSIVNRLFLI